MRDPVHPSQASPNTQAARGKDASGSYVQTALMAEDGSERDLLEHTTHVSTHEVSPSFLSQSRQKKLHVCATTRATCQPGVRGRYAKNWCLQARDKLDS